MNLRRFLVAVIAVELVAGAALAVRQWLRPAPPLADLSFVDPLAAADIRDLVRKCQSPDDWGRLGEAYLAYGYFPEAEACLRQAAAQEPARADRAYDWAFALERIGRNEAARQMYERAVELGHPRPGDCWYFVGRNWLREENADEARRAFQKAGDQPTARYEIARLLVRAGKPQEAIPILDRLSAEHPKAVQPYLLRHRIEVLQDDLSAALYADRAAHAPDVLPTPWDHEYARLEDVHDRMGLAAELRSCKELMDKRRFAQAEPRVREVLRFQWDPLAVDLLAKLAALRGEHEGAIHLYQEILDRAGPSTLYLTRLGEAYGRAGRPDAAAQAFTRVVQMGHTPDAKRQDYQHAMLAIYYEEKGDKDAFRRHKALACYERGHEAFWDEKLWDAQTALEEAVELEPKSPHAWFYLGETRQLLGQPTPARQAYQRCLEIDPDYTRAQTSLALLEFVAKGQGPH